MFNITKLSGKCHNINAIKVWLHCVLYIYEHRMMAWTCLYSPTQKLLDPPLDLSHILFITRASIHTPTFTNPIIQLKWLPSYGAKKKLYIFNISSSNALEPTCILLWWQVNENRRIHYQNRRIVYVLKYGFKVRWLYKYLIS